MTGISHISANFRSFLDTLDAEGNDLVCRVTSWIERSQLFIPQFRASLVDLLFGLLLCLQLRLSLVVLKFGLLNPWQHNFL